MKLLAVTLLLTLASCSSQGQKRDQSSNDTGKKLQIYERSTRITISRVRFSNENAVDAFVFLEHKIDDYCIQAGIDSPKIVLSMKLIKKLQTQRLTCEFDNISSLELLLYLCRNFNLKFSVSDCYIEVYE